MRGFNFILRNFTETNKTTQYYSIKWIFDAWRLATKTPPHTGGVAYANCHDWTFAKLRALVWGGLKLKALSGNEITIV